jgi:Tol biopolymer transport system component
LTFYSGNDYQPAWSPDGQWIAFVSDRNGNADIWMIEAP